MISIAEHVSFLFLLKSSPPLMQTNFKLRTNFSYRCYDKYRYIYILRLELKFDNDTYICD